ncbi:hypothetical protein EW146_g6488 [Bondarzewia mesenterica]|uniref:Uncharacterized protein n=1 Tax=Bondarzewia mesenterica TaxID=1095465 RepID=A0A4S4LQ99_9AGAM|nr:hypothetical protein EW146_g6488 [Bondarzewia mesenterica]
MVCSYAQTMHSALMDAAEIVPGIVFLITCRYGPPKTANTAAWMTLENSPTSATCVNFPRFRMNLCGSLPALAARKSCTLLGLQ